MQLPEGMRQDMHIKKVSPSILQRICAERWLANNVQQQDVVLCFGNLPPLFKVRGRAVVFVQNRYLIDDIKLCDFSLKVKLRLAIERLWLSTMMSNAYEFIVQTPTMKRLMDIKTRKKVTVQILPFVSVTNGYERRAQDAGVTRKIDFDFVYVASGEPHKNHQTLLQAWCKLADEGIFPTLCLTLNTERFASLCDDIAVLCRRHDIRVTNLGEIPHQETLLLYKKVGALIYPSTFESFGLPLIEARQAGLSVLASELDYVRDVLDPEQSFNPMSPISMARAVKRFMGINESSLHLLEVNDFIEHVMKAYERKDEI